MPRTKGLSEGKDRTASREETRTSAESSIAYLITMMNKRFENLNRRMDRYSDRMDQRFGGFKEEIRGAR